MAAWIGGGHRSAKPDARRRHRSRGVAAAFLVVAAFAAPPADAAWVHVEGKAVAELPAPAGNPAIAGGRLVCAEQAWVLLLDASPDASLVTGATTLSVDGRTFETRATVADMGVEIAVPTAALDPLRAGLRLSVSLPGGTTPAEFSLRGSRRAIDAAAPLCSPRDMSAYQRIEPTPFSSHRRLGERLRAADIEAFRIATASDPRVAAAMLTLDAERRLLVVETCGSSWYFGRTGCNLSGFAPSDGAEGWRLVLDMEGADLYADLSSRRDGWPDLIAVRRGGGAETLWAWTGERYAIRRGAAAGD